ncbi:MAG: response regulator [Candidatus Omnitrophica bacterium]|nr:response regulator [Candidatus Omnitrophota bacterium]
MTPPPAHAPRMLVVDDEERIGHALSRHFSSRGYEVRTARRGEEALALTKVFPPDIVLLDLLMPGMNGIDTLKALKQLSPAPKVLMLSAADHDDVIKGALQLGADLYLPKPINLSELERLVQGCCPAVKPAP